MPTASEFLTAGDLPGFAAAHGWRYDETAAPPASVGLWEQVAAGTVRDRIAGEGWEAGLITGGSRSASNVEQRGGWTVTTTVNVSTPERSLRVGYLAITLPRRVPNMVLDARSNDRGPFSSLIRRPAAGQHLSLEGDFDTRFRLYVPTGYERDALYVFTPDLMALLIDETGDLDVELRDDRLIVYKPGGFDLTDPTVWERFERIRATVGAKTWNRTDLYADERAAPELQYDAAGTVDAGGARLRGRMPRALWLGVGIGVVVLAGAVTIVVVVLTNVLSAFSR
ncbi:hypothetical protein [Protaetiibacter intestinalis]|uniref:DUF3137 domain-containing protein n=1 Tax=Protaetiibacter intestinalis TaxID=2419774 RepID=A0A387B0E0_9MICO|nr:hypothetical protein [Protaetiibacter intestinalis]AYF96944.1 hypothetical protein D7I47_00850 [Protaetiibacter intestinalis]